MLVSCLLQPNKNYTLIKSKTTCGELKRDFDIDQKKKRDFDTNKNMWLIKLNKGHACTRQLFSFYN